MVVFITVSVYDNFRHNIPLIGNIRTILTVYVDATCGNAVSNTELVLFTLLRISDLFSTKTFPSQSLTWQLL